MVATRAGRLKSHSRPHRQRCADQRQEGRREILRKADALTEAPYRGRKVPEVNDEQLREIPASAWRILYHVRQEQVFIVTLIHKRREPSAEDINSGSAQNE